VEEVLAAAAAAAAAEAEGEAYPAAAAAAVAEGEGFPAEAAVSAAEVPAAVGERAIMRHRKFISQLAHEQIHAAIHAAEEKSSGAIRIMVSHQAAPNPVATAQEAFLRLGMQATKHRNAVLIFVAPRSRTFAIIGDEAVHAKCGNGFWRELAAAMSGHFKRGDFTDGLLHGINRAGELLAEHFPPEPDDKNELPDEVIEDGQRGAASDR
jgi:uncharacterized membrane protein